MQRGPTAQHETVRWLFPSPHRTCKFLCPGVPRGGSPLAQCIHNVCNIRFQTATIEWKIGKCFFEVGIEVEQASVFALRQSKNVLRLDVAATCDACEHSCKEIFLQDVVLSTFCCASKKCVVAAGATPSIHMCRTGARPVGFQTIPPYYAFSSAQQ